MPQPPLHPRVLIVAEHASAKFGGEAILPLHYFRVLRKRGVETWLIVHARTQGELSALFAGDVDRIRFIPDTWVHKLLFRMGRPLPGQLRHFTLGFVSRWFSQRQARRVARELIAEHHIDIVHQPIPVSPKESSLLYGLGVPVVIGPMNGGMSYPPGFSRSQGKFVSSFMRVGRMCSGLVNRLMPGKLRAQMLLVANDRTGAALPAGTCGKTITLVENGVDLSLWNVDGQRTTSQGPIRFVFTGRLVDWKAVDVLLDAFAAVIKDRPATLDILGDGPMRGAWEAQSRALGLSNKVTFHGWMPQNKLAGRLRDADVLVLPSLYECGGAVILEAMACGLPVIASDWGGPADYLDTSCGVLVRPTTREQFVNDLAAAMRNLAESPEKLVEMGRAGRLKVEAHFDWERKVDRILEIYGEAIAVCQPEAATQQ